MSELNKNELVEFFEAREAKLLESLKSFFSASIEAAFAKFENLQLKMDQKISDKMSHIDRRIDASDMEVKQAMSRTAKLFDYHDAAEPRMAALEKKSMQCQDNSIKTADQEVRLRRIEKVMYVGFGVYGIILLALRIIGIFSI